eukprot:TRINITY_DN3299_c0_g1_i1.p1 TRINITY_DN3299_c0_g1~~TRINITY_DN3299_c0_g1_i1.p1  ORF type:complete len:140 (-),score=27.74 TRINITY_DN3299_c0_g1_i1:252-644(-)
MSDDEVEDVGWVSESQKIGGILIVFALGFGFMGVMMFLDTGLLSLANLLLIIGITLCMGFERLKNFLLRKDKIPFTLIFSVGIFLLLSGYSFFGFVTEAIGFFTLFRDFFPFVRTLASFGFRRLITFSEN